jgi:hypothetical protein
MLIIRRTDVAPRTRVSGKWSAVCLAVCFAISAVLVPAAAHLPHWVDFELVLGVWWCVWWIALSWILVNGHWVEDDAALPHKGRHLDDPIDLGCAAFLVDETLWGSCCCESLGWIGAVLLALVGVFVLVELVFPAIAFMLYILVRGMLARVANDNRTCEGKPYLAALWGSIWATTYTAPLAVIVWAVHALSRHVLR